jgi:hypothetical protein
MKLLLAWLRFNHCQQETMKQGIMRRPEVVAIELKLARDFMHQARLAKIQSVN